MPAHLLDPHCLNRPKIKGLLAAALCLGSPAARAQAGPPGPAGINNGAAVQKIADGILGLMSYMVAPDVTTSSMSIENASTANPGLQMLQAGGGYTRSKALPL